MKKQTKAERAAERYASRMHSLDTAHFHFAVANFRAGAAWQRKQDIAAVKKLAPNNFDRYGARNMKLDAIDAIRKAGK